MVTGALVFLVVREGNETVVAEILDPVRAMLGHVRVLSGLLHVSPFHPVGRPEALTYSFGALVPPKKNAMQWTARNHYAIA